MLRIARIDVDGNGLIQTLRLEGKLRGPWVDELIRACEDPQTPPSCLRLDLSALTFIDSAGAKLLDDLIRKGARVVGCSGFIAEMLNLNKS
ncbi:MAG: STAS domain-containing protein [Isosphaerales bacterium]